MGPREVINGSGRDGHFDRTTRSGRWRRWALRRPSLALLLLGVAGSATVFTLTSRSNAGQERELLRERTAEVATVLTSLSGQFRSTLQTVGSDLADGRAPQGTSVIGVRGAALLREKAGVIHVQGVSGSLHAPLTAGATVTTATLAALAPGGFAAGFQGRGAERVITLSLNPLPGHPGDVVYVEFPLPESVSVAPPPNSGDAFAGVDYAMYLGASEDAPHLVIAATDHLPLAGQRAAVVLGPEDTAPAQPLLDTTPGSVDVPSGHWLVVVEAQGSLLGTMTGALPWLLAAFGLLTTLLSVGIVESVLRRRERTLRHLQELRDKNRALDRAMVTLNRTAQTLERRERDFRVLFDANPNPMWAYDLDSLRFLAVNDAAIEQYGWSREEFLGMTVEDIRPPEDVPALLEVVRSGNLRGVASGTWRHRRKDGTTIEVEVSSHQQEFAGRRAVLVLARDVTDRRLLEEQLRHQAFHDSLTGLANRALFFDRVEHALSRSTRDGQRCAVALIDVDNFKTVNDSLGHATGDEVLAAMARRLREVSRPGDTVARLGGDEFAVLLEGVDGEAGAMSAGARLVSEMGEPVLVGGRQHVVTVSVGLAMAEGRQRAEDVVRHADVAMYEAKQLGRSRYAMFDPGMHGVLLDRLALTTDLRAALAGEGLRLLYQPQFDLRTGGISAMEALLRWDHPVRGEVAPDTFIPLAEEAGLIGVVDRWVLNAACRQLREWLDDGVPVVRIAVNISGADLGDAEFESALHAILETHGVPPHLLELEVTEGAAVRQTDAALATLEAVRRRGMTVSIDDFGTGYSMLGRLRELPTDRIKIDRSFVAAIVRARDTAPLVQAILSMGRALGREVVAEGVETDAQLEFLRKHGCEHAQGFLLARPQPAGEVVAFLARAGEGDLVGGTSRR